ncbi:MAG TPA: PIG-L deacetylase family protein [Candidatus Dormibacteraeota bacterium]|nr:PIG-L deacetylase family protein [Candidatus Dormibacteraeota bacterium]
MVIDPPAPASVLVVMAHPDDAEFSAGGTLARWTAGGCRVAYCICTDGDKGTSDPRRDPRAVAEERIAEQRAAARVLGVEEVLFLGYPDGTLQVSLELRRDVVRAIRRVRPEAVLCPDPTRRFGAEYINHPDHRVIGEVTLDAVYPSARDPLVFPELVAEGLEPHKVAQVWVSNPSEATCVVDITSTLEIKLDALSEHRSQIDESRLREFVPRRAAEVGAPHGLAAAEAYHLIRLR